MTSPHIFPRSLISLSLSLSLYIYIYIIYTHTYLYLYLSLHLLNIYIYIFIEKTHAANGFHLFIDMWAKYPSKKFCISQHGRSMGLVRDFMKRFVRENGKLIFGFTIWLFVTSPWKDPPFLSSVKTIYFDEWAIEKPWRTVTVVITRLGTTLPSPDLRP